MLQSLPKSAAVGLVLLLFVSLSYGDSAVGDFSYTSNPNAPWSYGSTATLGGSFVLMSMSSCGSLAGWSGGGSGAPGDPPFIYGNPTASSQFCGTGLDPTNELDMHPGLADQYAVVRWTAASSGSVNVNGFFHGLDQQRGTTTDVHILHDSVGIFSGNVVGTSTVPFNLTLAVLLGDTVDFAVGFGTDDYLYDSTGLSATIKAVPEPGSFILSASGLVALVSTFRQRLRSLRR